MEIRLLNAGLRDILKENPTMYMEEDDLERIVWLEIGEKIRRQMEEEAHDIRWWLLL